MVWALRGNARARDALHKNLPFKISVISYMEIVQGMKNTAELRVFVKQLRNWQIQVIQLDRRVSFRAMEWVEKFYLSHSLELADALIAATVVEAGERLLTANDKHYRQIKEIQIERFRP